jgi:hypothetical protein
MKRLGFTCVLLLLLIVPASRAQVGPPAPGAQPAQSTQLPPAAIANPSSAPSLLPPLLKIEPVGALKLDSGIAGWKPSDFMPVVGAIISGILAFAGVMLGLRFGARNTEMQIRAAQTTSDAALWQRANEDELRDIQSKLDSFFFPFVQLSEANRQFAQDIRSRQPDPGTYRLLMKLFDKMWLVSLPDGDKKLVELVCENAEVLERFIADRAGILDAQLLPYLSRASAHFRILQLAHRGELGSDASRFDKYVYPQQLEGVLGLEIERLRQRIEILRASPGSRPPAIEPLVIPSDLKLEDWVDPARGNQTVPHS